jgi:addiction module HigA family antidote
MINPVHPGRIVQHDCLEPLGLSVPEGAKVLGVTRQTLTKIVNGKSGISPEMAIRLTKAFGSTEETWLRMQLAYDLARRPQAREQDQGAPLSRAARIAGLVGGPGRQAEREELRYEAKLAALRTAIDEGDRSGVGEGNPFDRVRQALKLRGKKR